MKLTRRGKILVAAITLATITLWFHHTSPSKYVEMYTDSTYVGVPDGTPEWDCQLAKENGQ